jgi:hypothetical protein
MTALTLLAPLLAAGAPLPSWRPFVSPLLMGPWWPLTVVPLVLAIALVYKAIKIDDARQWPMQTLRLTGQILVIMVLAAVALWLVTKIM